PEVRVRPNQHVLVPRYPTDRGFLHSFTPRCVSSPAQYKTAVRRATWGVKQAACRRSPPDAVDSCKSTPPVECLSPPALQVTTEQREQGGPAQEPERHFAPGQRPVPAAAEAAAADLGGAVVKAPLSADALAKKQGQADDRPEGQAEQHSRDL